MELMLRNRPIARLHFHIFLKPKSSYGPMAAAVPVPCHLRLYCISCSKERLC